MLIVALAILLQLSLRHHFSAMAALLPGALDSGPLRAICISIAPFQNQIRELGSATATDYAGYRPASTNEINLKGYESALAVGPVTLLPHESAPDQGH